MPAVLEVGAWLREHMPRSGPATIVHGDYRLGNAMLSASAPARVVAIFDWELATIGDPLADVGYLCALWSERGDPPLGAFELSGATRLEGFPTRDELVARYAARSGRATGSSAGTARSRCGRRRSSWRATTAARSPARPTTRGCTASARASSSSPSAPAS